MTRETKVGLVIAAAFLFLVGGVVAYKMDAGDLLRKGGQAQAKTDPETPPSEPGAEGNEGAAVAAGTETTLPSATSPTAAGPTNAATGDGQGPEVVSAVPALTPPPQAVVPVSFPQDNTGAKPGASPSTTSAPAAAGPAKVEWDVPIVSAAPAPDPVVPNAVPATSTTGGTTGNLTIPSPETVIGSGTTASAGTTTGSAGETQGSPSSETGSSEKQGSSPVIDTVPPPPAPPVTSPETAMPQPDPTAVPVSVAETSAPPALPFSGATETKPGGNAATGDKTGMGSGFTVPSLTSGGTESKPAATAGEETERPAVETPAATTTGNGSGAALTPPSVNLERPVAPPPPPAVVGRGGLASGDDAHDRNVRPMAPVGAPPAAVSPPITAPTLTAAVRPGAARPEVESYDEETYYLKPADTLAGVSKQYYNSEKFDRALLMYNRNHPLAADGFQSDPAALRVGQPLYIPPIRILEKNYSRYISGLSPLPATGTAGPGAPPSPGAAVPAPEDRLRPAAAWSNSPAQPRFYKVLGNNERFRDVAARTLGNAERWWDISQLNPQITNRNDPLPAGTVLRLPAEARVDPANLPQ